MIAGSSERPRTVTSTPFARWFPGGTALDALGSRAFEPQRKLPDGAGEPDVRWFPDGTTLHAFGSRAFEPQRKLPDGAGGPVVLEITRNPRDVLGRRRARGRRTAALAFLIGLLAVAVPGCGRGSSTSGQRAPESVKKNVRLVAPRGDLDLAPREFRWDPVPGAEQYTVKISDADAIWPLFVKKTTASALVLDGKEAEAFTPGRIHVWEVQALDPSGTPVASGGTQFRVRPAGARGESDATVESQTTGATGDSAGASDRDGS